VGTTRSFKGELGGSIKDKNVLSCVILTRERLNAMAELVQTTLSSTKEMV